METCAYFLSCPQHTRLSGLPTIYMEPFQESSYHRLCLCAPSQPPTNRIYLPSIYGCPPCQIGWRFSNFSLSPTHRAPLPQAVTTPSWNTGQGETLCGQPVIPSDFWSAAKPRAWASKFTGKEPHAKAFYATKNQATITLPEELYKVQ